MTNTNITPIAGGRRSTGFVTEPHYDPYATIEAGYDLESFYCNATGDSVSGPRFRLSASVLADIGDLIASREIPEYKQAGDLIRDAIYHRLKYLQDHMPQLKMRRTLVSEAVAQSAIQAIQGMKSDEEAVKQIGDTLGAALAYRNRSVFERHMAQAEMLLDELEDFQRDRLDVTIIHMKQEAVRQGWT